MEFTRDGRIVAAPVAAPLPCPVPEPGMGMPVPGSCQCPIEELPCDSSVEVPRPSPPSSLMTCRDSPAPGQNDLPHIGEIPAPEHGAGVETDPIKWPLFGKRSPYNTFLFCGILVGRKKCWIGEIRVRCHPFPACIWPGLSGLTPEFLKCWIGANWGAKVACPLTGVLPGRRGYPDPGVPE